ncbi:MAG: methyltransferase domain-containing protein [Sulfurospirillaceae bacterium]|nr:methyltransferase domain-containing protein [Sulfurospirillaceae bacterium]
MSRIVLERKNHHTVSVCSPDYVLEKNINLFLNRFTSEPYETILDFGAGNSPYETMFTCKKYIKADVCQNQSGSINIVLDAKTFRALPIEDESVDMILCMDVLEHSGNVEAILKDFHRILKPKGRLLISVPFLYREHEMPHDLMRFTSSYMLREVTNVEFKDIEITKVGNTCFTLYSLWNESPIKHGEKIHISLMGRLGRKIFAKVFLPFCNIFVFDKSPHAEDSVYHHLLIHGRK